jgi:hypothetical protein
VIDLQSVFLMAAKSLSPFTHFHWSERAHNVGGFKSQWRATFRRGKLLIRER